MRTGSGRVARRGRGAGVLRDLTLALSFGPLVAAAGTLSAQTGTTEAFAGRVAVGPRDLYAECAGHGRPTVVLEAGAGMASPTWDAVWDALVGMTRTCRYDRAGLGRSSEAPLPEDTPAAWTDDLEALVDILAPDGPLLLVGHSAGALYVRLLAHRRRDRVAGLVLVDGLEEHHRTRVLQLPPPGDSSDARAWRDYLAGQRARQTLADDGVDRVVRDMEPARNLGHLPIRILSAEEPLGPPPPGFARGMIDHMERIWRDGQRRMEGLSTRTVRAVVPGTGHLLHRDRPDAVVSAVRDLLDLRTTGPSRR